MKTPICDFVRRYVNSGALRLHMPGHKGASLLGFEQLDITEIGGADSLYEAAGIIRESEKNASTLFGAPTFYSTEGSSQCIRAMLFLAMQHAKQAGKRPCIAAARNVHKTFLSAVALLDLPVTWLYGAQSSYLACKLTAADVEAALSAEDAPTAVYLTSPDYLGNVAEIEAIAAVCHRHGALLLVDNAHGAYLKFLPQSAHPIDLGADLCCDSAHKTLPALTGAAYLHVTESFAADAKRALALFGSTSPSYLILQSLDAVNAYLADGYSKRLLAFAADVHRLSKALRARGYVLLGDEPLKLTVLAKPYGYSGMQLAACLEEHGIVAEFADPDLAVLMLTPEIGAEGLARLEGALLSIPPRTPIVAPPPLPRPHTAVMTVREAMLAPAETVPVQESIGRVLASPSVGCPPAVPILITGERIDATAAEHFAYYGVETVTVVKE